MDIKDLEQAQRELRQIGREYLIGFHDVYLHKHPETNEDVLVVVVDIFFQRALVLYKRYCKFLLRRERYKGIRTDVMLKKYYFKNYRQGFMKYDPSKMYGEDWDGTPFDE